MQLVLDTDGAALKVEDNCFFIAFGEESRKISPTKITSIALTANTLLSSSAVRLAVEHSIPIFIFHPTTGKPEARLDSIYFQNLPEIRRKQAFFERSNEATVWIIAVFGLKKAHQIDNLEFLKNRKPSIDNDFAAASADMEAMLKVMNSYAQKTIHEVRQNILGHEGAIAKTYWQLIGKALDDPTLFDGRSRRPATDNFNAALNYAYGMLYVMVERAVLTVGLDPQLGFFHVDDYAKPTLVFDMIEPFRPWVDRLLLEAFLTDQIKAEFFEPAPIDTGIYLSKIGKAWLIPALNGWMEEKIIFDGQRLARKTHIVRFAGEFVKKLRNFPFQI